MFCSCSKLCQFILVAASCLFFQTKLFRVYLTHLVLRTRKKFCVLLVNATWFICNCTPNMPITNANWFRFSRDKKSTWTIFQHFIFISIFPLNQYLSEKIFYPEKYSLFCFLCEIWKTYQEHMRVGEQTEQQE